MEAAFELGSILVILGAPVANSSGLLNFAGLDNLGIRFVLVALLLAATRQGPLPAILTLLAVFTLFHERSLTLLSKLPNQMPHWPDNRQGIPREAAPRSAEKESISYSSHEEHGVHVGDHEQTDGHGKEFEDASDLQDSNPRLPEGPDNQSAPTYFQAKHLA